MVFPVELRISFLCFKFIEKDPWFCKNGFEPCNLKHTCLQALSLIILFRK